MARQEELKVYDHNGVCPYCGARLVVSSPMGTSSPPGALAPFAKEILVENSRAIGEKKPPKLSRISKPSR